MIFSKLCRVSIAAKWLVLSTALILPAICLQTARTVSAKTQPIPRVVILGGGSSHNFEDMYGRLDRQTLLDAGDAVRYTTSLAGLSSELKAADVLIQTSNQVPAPGAAAREAITKFVDSGGGLVMLHAGAWYNWPEWPEYNRSLVGGGTRSHDAYGSFEVTVTAPNDPVMTGVPATFQVSDELYHQEIDRLGPMVEVLATARSSVTGKTYPSIWAVRRGRGRIVCIALGHDEATHTDPAYRRVLVNATTWAARH